MRQLLLIDPLNKLNIKKDSSLILALSMQKRGIETYVFFEKDFGIHNQGPQRLKVHDFGGKFKADGIYLDEFFTTNEKEIELNAEDMIHMRLEPPFDSKYLRILWMLDHLCASGIKVVNDPRGIMIFNEKLFAYRMPGAIPSFVGQNLNLAKEFVRELDQHVSELILKPMDLFSGIGVEKLKLSNWEERFEKKINELQGPVIVQPFIEAVKTGEIRSLYFKGKELGAILKKPKEGEFLANIAQGAGFEATEVSLKAKAQCEKMVQELTSFGVDWIAFDILGDAVQEVNITCPGLLAEVSLANGKNLADEMIDLL
jgi:glutathione synthase